jgi:Zn-dependent protease with chaperone function
VSTEHFAPFALSWLLTYAIHSTVLLLAAWAACRLLPRAAMGAREVLWKLALVGSLASASVQLACSTEPWFGRWRVAPPAESGTKARIDPAARNDAADETAGVDRAEFGAHGFEGLKLEAASFDSAEFELDATPTPAELREEPYVSAPAKSPRAAAAFALLGTDNSRPQRSAALTALPAADFDARALWLSTLRVAVGYRLRALDWQRLALGFWAAGAGLGLFGFARAWWQLRRRLRLRTRLTNGALRAALDQLCEDAGWTRPVRLSCSPDLHAPVAFGVWHPEICVPVRALASLTPTQQRGMLAHELAHLLRRDPLWLCTGQLVERVLYVQPLNRLARRRIEDASEYLCDDYAARRYGGLALASCLAEIAGWLIPGSERRALRLAVGMARHPSRLAERIDRLLVEDAREERLLWLAPVGLCACTLLVLVAPGFSPSSALERRSFEDPLAAREPEAGGTEALEPSAEFAVTQAEPSIDAALSAFDAEIDTLTGEVAALRAELSGRDLERRFAVQLAALENRVAELSSRRARLRQLLAALSTFDPTSAAPAVTSR